MNKRHPSRLALLAIAFAAMAAPVRGEVVIIVSPQSSQVPQLDQVCQIFLGKLKAPKPISLVEPPATRDEFYSKLCKRNPAQVRAIWGKLIFTGSGSPPKEVASADEMKKAVAADPNTVGYIDRKDVDRSVRVVVPVCAACGDASAPPAPPVPEKAALPEKAARSAADGAEARGEVVVIVSAQSPQVPPVDKVCQVFLGKLKTPRPISMLEPAATRDEFYSKICKRDPAQVRAIWGKLIFTGSGTAPREVASADEMKKAVAADPNSVGYLDRKDVDASVKVIATAN
jgi:hypothetical protein